MQSSGIKDHNDCRPQSDLQGTYYLALLRQDNSDDLKGSCYPHHETILDSPDDLSNPEEDQDPTMATVTVRSVIVGVVMALIGGAIAQVCLPKLYTRQKRNVVWMFFFDAIVIFRDSYLSSSLS